MRGSLRSLYPASHKAPAAAARARQVEFDGKYVFNTDGWLPLDYPHLVIDTEALSPVDATQKIKVALTAAPSGA